MHPEQNQIWALHSFQELHVEEESIKSLYLFTQHMLPAWPSECSRKADRTRQHLAQKAKQNMSWQ